MKNRLIKLLMCSVFEVKVTESTFFNLKPSRFHGVQRVQLSSRHALTTRAARAVKRERGGEAGGGGGRFLGESEAHERKENFPQNAVPCPHIPYVGLSAESSGSERGKLHAENDSLGRRM